MATLSNKKRAKKGKKGQLNYSCEFCDFTCCKKYAWDRHVLTPKHIKSTIGNAEATKKGQKGHLNTEFKPICCEICGKEYSDRSGLWRHRKKCTDDCENTNINTNTNNPSDKELMCMLIKQNTELIKEHSDIKDMILEIVKNGITNTNNSHNTTNSHNKAFNLNFFLNETCKNAMNITDFVDSIKLQLSDLMEVGELGYVDGISKIIVKNLNNLDETIRPIHCTDKKRETMYIKDQGEWNKEDDKKTKLKKIITKIADKNIVLLPAFREKYPEYKNSSSKVSDIHDKLVIEVMETDDNKKDKIIHNISKATTIKS